MPAIRDRGEGNMRRKDRLAKLKKGPGVFVYNGSSFDHESIPTPLLTGRNEPVLDANGMPVMDSSGRQVYQRAGSFVRGPKGEVVMGGVPKIKRTKIDVFKIRGVEFPEGERVTVEDPQLALKLRGMDAFDEVEPEVEEETPEEAPKKRGRKPKAVAVEPEAEGAEG